MVLGWSILKVVVGAGLLAWGADRFVCASSAVATRFNVSRLLVGVLLVGFGTSFPELVVSIIAATHHKTQMAIGNVVGSNIANIGLVLGLAVLIAPIQVNARLIKREFPVLIIVSLLAGFLMWNGYLSRWDGAILLLALLAQLVWMLYSMSSGEACVADELAQGQAHDMTLGKTLFWWLAGLVFLLLGSEFLVDGAVEIAECFGVSELVIGLTIVTLGTSLPELAATIVSACRHEHDIALGHIVGSNMFNLLAVLAMPALIAPGLLSSEIVSRDYPIMLCFTVLLWLFMLCLSRKAHLGRLTGAVFLLAYVFYIGCLVAS